MRQKLLNKFCISLFKFNFLRDSEEVKIFLKPDLQDVKRELGKISEQSTEDLLQKYKNSLNNYSENYDVQAGRHKINEFQNFLKKALLNIRVNKIIYLIFF